MTWRGPVRSLSRSSPSAGAERARPGRGTRPGRIRGSGAGLRRRPGRRRGLLGASMRPPVQSRRRRRLRRGFAAFWAGTPVPGMQLEQVQTPRPAQERREQAPGCRAALPRSSRAGGGPSRPTAIRRTRPNPTLWALDSAPSSACARWTFESGGRRSSRPPVPTWIGSRGRCRGAAPDDGVRVPRGPAIDRRGHPATRDEDRGPSARADRGSSAGPLPAECCSCVDVSGSMEPYARPLIMFCQAARHASSRVEASRSARG